MRTDIEPRTFEARALQDEIHVQRSVSHPGAYVSQTTRNGTDQKIEEYYKQKNYLIIPQVLDNIGSCS